MTKLQTLKITTYSMSNITHEHLGIANDEWIGWCHARDAILIAFVVDNIGDTIPLLSLLSWDNPDPEPLLKGDNMVILML